MPHPSRFSVGILISTPVKSVEKSADAPVERHGFSRANSKETRTKAPMRRNYYWIGSRIGRGAASGIT